EGAEPSPDIVEVPLIDIHSNDPLCSCAVDLFEAVAARHRPSRVGTRTRRVSRMTTRSSEKSKSSLAAYASKRGVEPCDNDWCLGSVPLVGLKRGRRTR